ncbi:MAG TPA: methyltransferase domain-containing protein [Pyrinomonadaceae bacterium]|nr:methyltransferase domain-containing protein [Pyrinomonadaceae bacterium]
MKNSHQSLPRTGEGIVIDIGTGDGRFVSAMAKRDPNKFFIGIDANVKPLEKPSMKATRKPNKGGLSNVMFVQAAVEDLPKEFDGVADEVHIHFPWGSLLRAVANGESDVLQALRRVAAPECQLEIVIGIDPERDRAELARLGIENISDEYLRRVLAEKYSRAGFVIKDHGELDRSTWLALETSWARKLQSNSNRRVFFLIGRAV